MEHSERERERVQQGLEIDCRLLYRERVIKIIDRDDMVKGYEWENNDVFSLITGIPCGCALLITNVKKHLQDVRTADDYSQHITMQMKKKHTARLCEDVG